MGFADTIRQLKIWTGLFLLVFSILVFLSIKFFDLFEIQIASWNFQSFSHNISYLKKMEELKLKLITYSQLSNKRAASLIDFQDFAQNSSSSIIDLSRDILHTRLLD